MITVRLPSIKIQDRLSCFHLSTSSQNFHALGVSRLLPVLVLHKQSLFVYILSFIYSTNGHLHCQVTPILLISFPQEVELWEASCYGQLDKLIALINAGTSVNVATGVSSFFVPRTLFSA